MKKATTIILSAIFCMGITLAGPVFATDNPVKPMHEMHHKADKKMHEMVDGKAVNATSEKQMHEMKDKAKHEMHEMKEKTMHEMHEMHDKTK